jgi:ribose transport system substrate-binding protein
VKIAHTPRVTTRALRPAVLVAILVPAITGASCSGGEQAADETKPIRSSATVGRTLGPNGEKAVPDNALTLTSREIARVRGGQHSAALVWHEDADFTEAVTAGVRDEFRRLGISVVAQTSAGFDPAKQRADIETVAVKKPDVMLTLPVDPVITAAAYKQVARQGTKIVLLSNLPRGMTHGRDYVNVVTDDLFDMGKRAADALAAAVGREGDVGYFYRDANSFVANQRDRAFLETITQNYPQVDVVAKQGIADPNTAQEQANGALVRHPDLDGVYVTFSQPVGDGVLAALRANGNSDTKIVSLDLDEPLALDMAKRGQTFALIADRAFELGEAMAKSAAYGLLGKPAPPFVIVPSLTITRSNLVEGYRESLNRDPPASVMQALGE